MAISPDLKTAKDLPYNDIEWNLFSLKTTPIYNRPIVCTIIGSLRFMPKINLAIDNFDEAGIWVPAPKKGEVVNSSNGYKILDADGNSYPVDVEASYVNALLNSDVAYIVNPRRHIGFTSVIEALIARNFFIPVLSAEPLDPDLDKDGEYSDLWKNFCGTIPVAPIEEATQRIKNLKDPIYKQRCVEFFRPRDDEIEIIVSQILHMDWIKHRGLGAVVNWVNEAWQKRIIPHWGPHTRISEYYYDNIKETYEPDEKDKLLEWDEKLDGHISIMI